jgi:hypothetical protein
MLIIVPVCDTRDVVRVCLSVLGSNFVLVITVVLVLQCLPTLLCAAML